MRRIKSVIVLVSIALLTVSTPGVILAQTQRGATITIDSLLREMVDMKRLAAAPDPGEETDQQSSYDRASVAPDKDGWFANGDAGKFIRSETHGERTEFVMAEMTGPGAILRLWSANPDGGGTIRIYIDDMAQPALEADFLALTSAQMPEFPAPFSGRRSRGANLYFPLPYQNQCKVTVDKRQLYYHVGYRTFPAGTVVEPFSMGALDAVKGTMQEVGQILAEPEVPFTIEGAELRRGKLELAPGERATAFAGTGPGAIVRLTVRVSIPGQPDADLADVLRGTALTIEFDDEAQPCVWAPLGDFFGSTPGVNPYASLPVGMDANNLCYANWYMPFARRFLGTVHNETDSPINLAWSVWTNDDPWDARKSMYFRAGWRKEWLPAEPQFVDWRLLEATGPGRFVGVMLGVMNTKSYWWGEGDEKVWVDDDTFPSYFGTGSEDYFGYAWCDPGLFTHAYHNQSIVTGPGNFGYSAVARYHISDDIPFDKSIKFDIEKWAAADREYCCTTYWYAVPGATSFFKPVPVEERGVRPLPEMFHVQGAAEGENLQVARRTGGSTQRQGLAGEFSYANHLWWTDAKVGDILELRVPVPEPGKYQLTVGFTKSWDYGIHQPMIDGKDAGEPLDLYAAAITPLKVEFGQLDLTGKEMLFGLRCVGTNPDAKPVNYMAGIDYVLLTPVE